MYYSNLTKSDANQILLAYYIAFKAFITFVDALIDAIIIIHQSLINVFISADWPKFKILKWDDTIMACEVHLISSMGFPALYFIRNTSFFDRIVLNAVFFIATDTRVYKMEKKIEKKRFFFSFL